MAPTSLWLSGNINTPQTMTGVAAAWQIVGMGDFNGDDRADVMWRNVSSGQNVIWRSGLASTPQAMAVLAGADWKVKGVTDFNGDGLADVLWRNEVLGQNRIWKSGNAATLIPVANLAGTAWKIVGVGDFEGDGKGDILWRNTSSGLNVIWRNGVSTTGAQPADAHRPGLAGGRRGRLRQRRALRHPVAPHQRRERDLAFGQLGHAEDDHGRGCCVAGEVRRRLQRRFGRRHPVPQRRRERDLAFGQRLDVAVARRRSHGMVGLLLIGR